MNLCLTNLAWLHSHTWAPSDPRTPLLFR
jgi:hypothetical protein